MAEVLIDLSKLPPPDIVENLDALAILEAALADFAARFPEFDVPAASDPSTKILEVSSAQIATLRQRVNDAARGVLLATATGTDLDHLAAFVGVQRLVVTPGDPTAIPPVADVLEDDEALRLRAQLALQGLSVAGPRSAYEQIAFSADGRVRDVAVDSPSPGTVRVTLLSNIGDGTAPQDLIDAVDAAASADDARPLTDFVQVQGATIVPVTITATLVFDSGPGAAEALAAATAALETFATDQKVGRDVFRSKIISVLHVEGVQRVDLAAPAADVPIAVTEAAFIDVTAGVTIIDGGVGEA